MTDIQVVLVEDDQQTRITMRAALRAQDGIEVASEATNGETGLVLLESIDVDVAVVDSSLPDMSLAEFGVAMRELQAESYVTQSKLLILVDTASDLELLRVFGAKAEGYCLKQAPIEQLAEAVRVIHAGNFYLDASIAQTLLSLYEAKQLAVELTHEEIAELSTIAAGDELSIQSVQSVVSLGNRQFNSSLNPTTSLS